MNREILFYPGLHQPSDAKHFARACINVHRLQGRKKPLGGCRLIVDSGSFMELALHGGYRHPVKEHAAALMDIAGIAEIDAAVAQDFMCEPFMLAKTGLTVAEHQRLTIERYDALVAYDLPFPVMPVLQGYRADEYARHVELYGDRLRPGQWVGVGSVCKRNSSPESIMEVLATIRRLRPDLRLHGFGVKLTAILHAGIRALLDTADSMAWSLAARRQGRNANDWREAAAFTERVAQAASLPVESYQLPLALA